MSTPTPSAAAADLPLEPVASTSTPTPAPSASTASTTTIHQGSSPKEIKVCIVSDAICPFCYIGYRNLQRAIETYRERARADPDRYPAFEFHLEFKPFLLDPTLGKQGVEKREKYAAKFGGRERMQVMEQMMKQKGEACGIHL